MRAVAHGATARWSRSEAGGVLMEVTLPAAITDDSCAAGSGEGMK